MGWNGTTTFLRTLKGEQRKLGLYVPVVNRGTSNRYSSWDLYFCLPTVAYL